MKKRSSTFENGVAKNDKNITKTIHFGKQMLQNITPSGTHAGLKDTKYDIPRFT